MLDSKAGLRQAKKIFVALREMVSESFYMWVGLKLRGKIATKS